MALQPTPLRAIVCTPFPGVSIAPGQVDICEAAVDADTCNAHNCLWMGDTATDMAAHHPAHHTTHPSSPSAHAPAHASPPLPPYPPPKPNSPPFSPAPPNTPVQTLWCRGVCPLTESEITTSDAKTIATFNNSSGVDTSAPKCNLCEVPHLFIVSIGGRTGSTTVLNMMNAHPIIRLAGEGGGQIELAQQLYSLAARAVNHNGASLYCSDPNNEAAACDAWQRGAVSPADVLCDLQSYFDDVAVPVFNLLPPPQVSIRGFKDITGWSVDTLKLLHTIFPCARIIYSVTEDPTSKDQVEAYESAFKMTPASVTGENAYPNPTDLALLTSVLLSRNW